MYVFINDWCQTVNTVKLTKDFIVWSLRVMFLLIYSFTGYVIYNAGLLFNNDTVCTTGYIMIMSARYQSSKWGIKLFRIK